MKQKVKTQNPVALALRSGGFKQRIVKSKVKYNRKKIAVKGGDHE